MTDTTPAEGTEGHEHLWQRRQSVTSRGDAMPAYEVCVIPGCGRARRADRPTPPVPAAVDPMEASRPAWDAARRRYPDSSFRSDHDRALSRVAFTEGWAAALDAAGVPALRAGVALAGSGEQSGECACLDDPEATMLDGWCVHVGFRHRTGTPAPVVPDSGHVLTKYGTTTCPVEAVRAEVVDGECSACGAAVPDSAGVRGAVAARVAFEEAGVRLIATVGSDATRYLDALTRAAAAGATVRDLDTLASSAVVGQGVTGAEGHDPLGPPESRSEATGTGTESRRARKSLRSAASG